MYKMTIDQARYNADYAIHALEKKYGEFPFIEISQQEVASTIWIRCIFSGTWVDPRYFNDFRTIVDNAIEYFGHTGDDINVGINQDGHLEWCYNLDFCNEEEEELLYQECYNEV